MEVNQKQWQKPVMLGCLWDCTNPQLETKQQQKTLLNIFITPIELMNIFSDIHVYILFLFMKQKLVSIQMS